MSDPKDTSPVLAYEANCELRNAVGEDFRMAEFITDEKIEACEALLQQATDDFFTDAATDLQQLEKLTIVPAEANDVRVTDDQLLETHIYNIKSLAKVLGFTLITEVCVHFISTIHGDSLPEQKRLALLQKLTETLRLAFNRRIRDDGGSTGKALLASLRKHIRPRGS